MISEMRAPSRLSYGRIPNLVELKDLIAIQLDSFKWFKSEGLRELCLLYTSPSPRDLSTSRMPSSA